jgi:hypothetical protein
MARRDGPHTLGEESRDQLRDIAIDALMVQPSSLLPASVPLARPYTGLLLPSAPHEYTRPHLVRARVWRSPAATATTWIPSSASMRLGESSTNDH